MDQDDWFHLVLLTMIVLIYFHLDFNFYYQFISSEKLLCCYFVLLWSSKFCFAFFLQFLIQICFAECQIMLIYGENLIEFHQRKIWKRLKEERRWDTKLQIDRRQSLDSVNIKKWDYDVSIPHWADRNNDREDWQSIWVLFKESIKVTRRSHRWKRVPYYTIRKKKKILVKRIVVTYCNHWVNNCFLKIYFKKIINVLIN